jgi:hypothetical protein
LKDFQVESGVSIFDGKAFVNIIIDGESHQVRPAKSREMAMMLLECAEASVHEAVLFDLLSESGEDKQSGARMIAALRDRRAKFEEED